MTEAECSAILKGCANKRTYFTKKDAQTVANGLHRGITWREVTPNGRRVHKPNRRVSVYQCHYCNYWHLTSNRERSD